MHGTAETFINGSAVPAEQNGADHAAGEGRAGI